MSKSYQLEIPKARVNITLDVDKNGSKTKKELPLKLLMLGDFSNGQATDPIHKRDKLNINKHNFNQVLANFAPKLNFSVKERLNPQAGDTDISLTINSLKDFKPENIVDAVPSLSKLMAMRNLLKDLKSNLIDNQAFRKSLEKILQNPHTTEQLLEELPK